VNREPALRRGLAVLNNSKVSSAVSEKTTNEELRKWLEGLSDEDLGRFKM
jgi:hypothetical protein